MSHIHSHMVKTSQLGWQLLFKKGREFSVKHDPDEVTSVAWRSQAGLPRWRGYT